MTSFLKCVESAVQLVASLYAYCFQNKRLKTAEISYEHISKGYFKCKTTKCLNLWIKMDIAFSQRTQFMVFY